MIKADNISQLFTKLNSLNRIFTEGEKLKPVISSLSEFVIETVPLLEKINLTVMDSTKKIPKASHQIQSVTSATELATTEILDLVDVLNQDLQSVENTILKCVENENKKEEFINSLVPVIKKEDAQSFVNDFLNNNGNIKNLSTLESLIKKMKTDTNSITISLQVQDITAQQLATVNHLIESVQSCLASLIEDFDKHVILEDHKMEIDLPEDSTFDPNARYTKSNLPQQEVDSIFNNEIKPVSQSGADN